MLGYAGSAAGMISGILQIVRYLRNKKSKDLSEDPTEQPEEGPFDDVPLDGETPPVEPEEESSFPRTSKLQIAINGVNIAGIVFGVAGLATTIGLGVWTLEQLNDATDNVAKRQAQVTKFQTAMKKSIGWARKRCRASTKEL